MKIKRTLRSIVTIFILAITIFISAKYIYTNRVDFIAKFPYMYTIARSVNYQVSKVKDVIHEKQESKKFDKNVNIVINGLNYYLDDEDIDNKKDLKQMVLSNENIVKFENLDKVESIKINDTEIDYTKEYKLKIDNISDENDIKISIKYNNNDKFIDYYINTLPDKFPKFSVKGESPYEGEYYLTTYGHDVNYIYKLNEKGQVTFYKQIDTSATDFKKIVNGNEIRYSYLEEISQAKKLVGVGYDPTSVVILDENYNEINRITMKEHKSAKEGDPTESHDFIYIADNHYIVTSYIGMDIDNVPSELKETNEKSKVVNCVIQEVKDNTVVWQWESINYKELYFDSVECNDYDNKENPYSDYAHLNSIYIDPKDNNLICSFRNLDAVLKLDRKTGDIIWILGGKSDQFGLNDEQKFSRQHNATITNDGSILLYDNGYINKQSRVVKILLDEDNKKVLKYDEYKIDGEFYEIMGSAQELDDENDVYLIGWGGSLSNNQSNNFSEINFKSGDTLFELSLDNKKGMYRVYKFK